MDGYSTHPGPKRRNVQYQSRGSCANRLLRGLHSGARIPSGRVISAGPCRVQNHGCNHPARYYHTENTIHVQVDIPTLPTPLTLHRPRVLYRNWRAGVHTLGCHRLTRCRKLRGTTMLGSDVLIILRLLSQAKIHRLVRWLLHSQPVNPCPPTLTLGAMPFLGPQIQERGFHGCTAADLGKAAVMG